MDRILVALEGGEPAYLIGGAVRDLLRGESTRDVDVVVEGSARAAAQALGAQLGVEPELHERFDTATVRTPEARVDLAASRRERYPLPGALPEVEHDAPIEDDLGRRDFSVNAMAAPLEPTRRGELLDPHRGRDDLEAGLIRVLHKKSFVDDPTRLLRAVRYEARLGFAMEPEAEALARAAIADRVSDTVSSSRLGAEVLLLLEEERMDAALTRLSDLGLDRALDPALAPDPALAARARRAASATGAAPVLAALAALVAAAPDALDGWLGGLGLRAGERDRVARAARSAPNLARELGGDRPLSASALDDLLRPEPAEALALAVALGAPTDEIDRYTGTVRRVGLSIDGNDLVAAGLKPSPALGRALAETLRRKLDGEVSGRDDELRMALGAGAWGGGGAMSAPGPIEVDLPGARVAFTTRLGGVSEGPYRSLNLGVLTDDEPGRVAENRVSRRRRRRARAGRGGHGPPGPRGGSRGVDAPPRSGGFARLPARRSRRSTATLTDLTGIGLLVLGADCMPVALAAPGRVAMLHCGWRGLAAGIVETRPRSLRRAPGRGARPRDRALLLRGRPRGAGRVRRARRRGDGPYARHPGRGPHKLAAAGVTRIEDVDLCTSCREDLFFSHRRDAGVTGRQAGLVWRT